MGFRLRDHTADVAVEATAPELGGLFGAIADGLAAAMCDSIPEEGGDRFEIECRAEGIEALLYEYLDQLIYERDVRLVLPVENAAEITSLQDTDGDTDTDGGTDTDGAESAVQDTHTKNTDEWIVTASARAVPLDTVTARDIKAVTYSEMTVEQREGGWYGYVVFDV